VQIGTTTDILLAMDRGNELFLRKETRYIVAERYYGDKRTSLGGKIVSQGFVFAFCVLFPGLTTAVAPVSWVKFQRNGDRVTARVQVCAFFVVPYKTMTVDPVIGISDRSKSDRVTQERRGGKLTNIHTEGAGFLVIQGEGQTAEVSVTPHNLKSVVEQSNAFLVDPQAKEMKLFLVANWKFSVVMGGVLTLLTVLYVVGVVLGFFAIVFRSARGLLRFAGDTDPRASGRESDGHAEPRPPSSE
jgi:hypothetical protein